MRSLQTLKVSRKLPLCLRYFICPPKEETTAGVLSVELWSTVRISSGLLAVLPPASNRPVEGWDKAFFFIAPASGLALISADNVTCWLPFKKKEKYSKAEIKYNQNNFDVNTVNPLKKNVNKPLQTHKLENFTTNRNRTIENDNNLLNNLIGPIL